jgi:hypothetical protein
MYGILRGAYDGHAEKTFGNNITRSYPNCHFAMLAGVTDVIHADERASLGERFLKYQMVSGHNYVQDEHIIRALTGMANQVKNDDHVRNVVAGYTLKHDAKDLKIPLPPKWVVERLVALSQIIGHLRATIPVNFRGDMVYRPSPEVGTRIAKQILKLGQCLAVVFGTKGLQIDRRCYRLMERVALDTAIGWNLDILRFIMERHPKTTMKENIDLTLNIPTATSQRRLENMVALKVLHKTRQKTGVVGQPPMGYAPTDFMAQLWKRAKIGDCDRG